MRKIVRRVLVFCHADGAFLLLWTARLDTAGAMQRVRLQETTFWEPINTAKAILIDEATKASNREVKNSPNRRWSEA